MLVRFGRSWIILISNHAPTSRWGYIVLHEFAHLWRHQEPGERWEPVFTMVDELKVRYDREGDADLMAAMTVNSEVWK